ncbi:MAG: menaquinone biosynthesis protein [Planctomycetota bacterium]|nr:menaquinone biosynthesis protein [Planctomycetota bacterium]
MASNGNTAPASGAPLRLGCVPYLNSKVLIWNLASRGTFAGADGNPVPYTLILEPPSLLARRLAAGALDVALVSSVEFFRHPGYSLVPGLSVTGRGEMWSIQLFHRVPLARAKRIGLDPSSETTNALLRIVLRERLGLAPEYVALAPGENPRARADLDGFLLIGDPALAFQDPGYEACDLLKLWDALTGLPFVFAAWLVREGADLRGAERWLQAVRDEGLRRSDEVAAAWHAEAGIGLERAKAYVARIVHYGLGPEEQAGLERFADYLERHGLARARTLRFYGG